MSKEELKNKIEQQEEHNISLFKIFQYRLHEREMQPTIEEWREGSKKLKELLKELQELEAKERESSLNATTKETKEIKTFVNSFGEATTREITSTGYKREEKRRQKEIMSFLGNR
jgi:alanyl-tRNA synthetase